MKILKNIWTVIKIAITVLFVAVVYLFTKKKTTSLNTIQKKTEKEAEEEYEKMSDDDVVDSLVNANDIRNTARDGGAERANSFRALFHNKSR